MTEYAYDGNAALKMSAPEAPPQGVQERRRSAEPNAGPAPDPNQGKGPVVTKTEPEPKPKGARKLAFSALAVILVMAAMVVMILASSAQLVVVNDELVGLRSELQTLQEEETKLMAQYELAYDLQEIEKQMTESGQMNKVQAWQTYTLELSEPDSVEYFQGWDFQERLAEFGRNFLQAVKEYF
ncbi:MAG: hypothetical protein IJO69_09715 [Ruminiclostridium sp.]|nr:hypothetical protein [Ruminiclostridium sp.]MBQ9934094.1 hypothetical protein [Ruminiclostridium sp.]